MISPMCRIQKTKKRISDIKSKEAREEVDGGLGEAGEGD